MTRTCWQGAIKLDWATVNSTILVDSKVRDLLTLGKGSQMNYGNANLNGANLQGLDLGYLNFQGANLSRATFQGASLEWTNLAQTRAIATNFTNTKMTGARGLGTWNIDETTQLENIDCRWIYLLEDPKPGTDDQERRPSSGEFLPDEFTALFREAIDTVDLIFRNGLQWKAFTQSFQNAQLENQDLEIRSIENKGNGIVVVKLNVSSNADKSHIHQKFMQFYAEAVAFEAKQTQRLEQHEQEIQSMRSMMARLIAQSTSEWIVILNIGTGNFEVGFPVTLQIFKEEHSLPVVQRTGQLPANPQLLQDYQAWRVSYRQSLQISRLEVPNQVTNVGVAELRGTCLDMANRLSHQLNGWLRSHSFAAISREMQIQLTRDRGIRIILQTDDHQLRQLPWQAWEFLNDYPKAEIALSHPEYQSPSSSCFIPSGSSVRILAILGDDRGIDLQADKASLQALDAEVKFLVAPQQTELKAHLWEQQWDILFFAGHSSSDLNGTTTQLQINSAERVEIFDLKFALKAAIAHGLKLAIFNSCDGLGLTHLFADLQLPQLILMREPVSDGIAQTFLMHFLKRFSSGHPLYQSVREARERLQEVEKYTHGSSWLPVIIQNPSESPLHWQNLHRS
jgi:uncharacterized protein YjbI with pentapeptide repeats